MYRDIKIYLDLDGVLCDLDGAYVVYGYKDNQLLHLRELAYKIGPKFWSDLGFLEDGRKLVQYIRKNFLRKNIYILSSIGRTIHPTQEIAQIGKTEWVRKNVPWVLKENILLSKGWREKTAFSKKNCYLIDDKENNISYWNEHGEGFGILHRNFENTKETLENYLELL